MKAITSSKKIQWSGRLCFYVGIFVCSMGMAFSQVAKKPTLMAGAATVNITPTMPVPMSGYANRDQPHKGVHDEIFARAFVFDDGKNKTCLIQADLIGFPFELVDEVSGEIEKKTGIPKANCLIVASHNHGAPTTRAYGEQATENLTAYLADLKKKLVATATEAYTKRVPVSIGFGKGKCTMNINRRARHHEGGIWLGRNPDGPCDHDVDVIRVNNATKEAIGLMVNWPCHATASGQENYSITGDWPGSAARYVNKNFKEGMPVAITAGASGDINPIYGPGNNFGEIDAIGLVLGEEIVRVAKGIDNTQAIGTVAVLTREVQVPGKERSATRMPNEKLVPSDPVKIRLSVVKVGAMVMVGISGEVMTEIGMKIKELSPFSNTTIVTHCNGSSGYLCTDAAYQEGGYEALASRTMPGVEKIIVDNVVGMLGEF
jgi:neutral ceramidase